MLLLFFWPTSCGFGKILRSPAGNFNFVGAKVSDQVGRRITVIKPYSNVWKQGRELVGKPGAQKQTEAPRAEFSSDAQLVIEQLEKELLRARETERELVKLKAALISRANHEFRTPLTIIEGIASRMSRQSDKLSPAEIEARCDSIRKSVNELITMTNVLMQSISEPRK